MRDRETIDSELRLLAAELRSIREHGGEASTRQVDELLDERLGHRVEPAEIPRLSPSLGRSATKPTPSRLGSKGALQRFGRLAALPLSLVVLATVLLVMFAVHNPHPVAQPTIDPPSGPPIQPAAPTHSAAPKLQAPPPDHAPTLDLLDRAFIDALKQVGVPVPSPEYAMNQGHAVCDSLAKQPDFAEAVRFVQQSTIWDANQSATFATAATVSYCPQHEPTSSDEMQQTFQNALSDLQAIQRDLQGIRDNLPAIPGR